MKESNRTKFLKELYKNEIKDLLYEIYRDGSNSIRIRTGMLLNDDFNTFIKLEEIGLYSIEKVNDLLLSGYKLKANDKVLVKK